jgi:hypothetical protein
VTYFLPNVFAKASEVQLHPDKTGEERLEEKKKTPD